MLHNQKVNYAFIFLTSESDGLAYIIIEGFILIYFIWRIVYANK